jgi:fatty acid desaturase
LSRDEIKTLTRKSDLAGAVAVVGSWAMIAASFAALAWSRHPIVWIAVVVVLGGRQLALAIAMHEAAHGTLFRTRVLNDVVADLACARPVFGDVARYKRHHLRHHAHTGTERDPDLGLAPTEPMTRASLARKFARDLSGVSGLRRVFGVVLMDLELLEYDVGGGTPERLPWRGSLAHARAFAKNAGPAILANALMAGVLVALGCGVAYVAWVVAYLTTYGLFLRVRSLAEHACTARVANPLQNTRTTRAGLLARLTVAPLCVNHHLEHHLLPTVPWFRLPSMGRLLEQTGALPPKAIAGSYAEVLRIVSGQ